MHVIAQTLFPIVLPVYPLAFLFTFFFSLSMLKKHHSVEKEAERINCFMIGTILKPAAVATELWAVSGVQAFTPSTACRKHGV